MARKRFTTEQVIMASPRDLRTVVRLLAVLCRHRRYCSRT